MTAEIRYDASDFRKVAELFERLPKQMQRVAFRRAAARTRKVVERQYARFAAAHVQIPQRHITRRMRSTFGDGIVELVVKSSNIPLHELGAAQRKYGVFVRGRGRYEGAFIPGSRAKRAAGLVLQRRGSKRLPTEMLFGPSPAGAITRSPGKYQDILSDVARGEFASVIMQQVEYLLMRP